LHDPQPRCTQLPLQDAAVVTIDPQGLAHASAHRRLDPFELPPRQFGALGHGLVAVHEPQREAVESPPFQPLYGRGPLRLHGASHAGIVKPFVVVARDLEGRGLEQRAAEGFAAVHRRHPLPPGYLSEHPPPVGKFELHERHGPEGGRPADRDEGEQPRDHRDGERQRAAREPHQRLAMGGEARVGRTQASWRAALLRVHAPASETSAARPRPRCSRRTSSRTEPAPPGTARGNGRCPAPPRAARWRSQPTASGIR